MCEFRPGSGDFFGFIGKTTENVRNTKRNPRISESQFLVRYFLSISLLQFLAVCLYCNSGLCLCFCMCLCLCLCVCSYPFSVAHPSRLFGPGGLRGLERGLSVDVFFFSPHPKCGVLVFGSVPPLLTPSPHPPPSHHVIRACHHITCHHIMSS